VSRDHAEDVVVKDWSLSEPMVTFDIPESGTPDTPQEPEEPTVSIPDHFHIVQDVNARFPVLLDHNTQETCGEFTELVVLALHAIDSNWGHVGKRPGQTQYNGHAVDAVMYRTVPDKAIDIIGGAENPFANGTPAWMEVPSGGQPWMAPVPVDDVTPKPEEPKPQPAKDWSAEIAALSQRVEAAEQSATAAQSAALIAIGKAEAIERNVERKLAEGLTATGKVDLPVVNEGWTRLRAKGDVVLKVKG
jgi:hypothetical protein